MSLEDKTSILEALTCLSILYTYLKVLGLVQNMSHYVCPQCQHKAYLFGQDGAKDVAKEMDLELLGTV